MSLRFKLNYKEKSHDAHLSEILKSLIKFVSDWKHKTPIYSNIKIEDPTKFVEFFIKRLMYDYGIGGNLLKTYQELEKKLPGNNVSYVLNELTAGNEQSAGGRWCNPVSIAQRVGKIPLFLREISQYHGHSENPAVKELLERLNHEHLEQDGMKFFEDKFKEISLSKNKDQIYTQLNKYAAEWMVEYNAEVGNDIGYIIKDLTILREDQSKQTTQHPTPGGSKTDFRSPYSFSKDQLKIIDGVSKVLEYFEQNVRLACQEYFPFDFSVVKRLKEYSQHSIIRVEPMGVAKLLDKGYNEYEKLVEEVKKSIKASTVEDSSKYKTLSQSEREKMRKEFTKFQKNLIKDCEKVLQNIKKYFKEWEIAKKEKKGLFQTVKKQLSRFLK